MADHKVPSNSVLVKHSILPSGREMGGGGGGGGREIEKEMEKGSTGQVDRE